MNDWLKQQSFGSDLGPPSLKIYYPQRLPLAPAKEISKTLTTSILPTWATMTSSGQPRPAGTVRLRLAGEQVTLCDDSLENSDSIPDFWKPKLRKNFSNLIPPMSLRNIPGTSLSTFSIKGEKKAHLAKDQEVQVTESSSRRPPMAP